MVQHPPFPTADWDPRGVKRRQNCWVEDKTLLTAVLKGRKNNYESTPEDPYRVFFGKIGPCFKTLTSDSNWTANESL